LFFRSLIRTFAPDNDDIDYRTVDSITRHDARFRFCILYEGRNVRKATKDIVRLRIGCNGGGIGFAVGFVLMMVLDVVMG